MHAFIFLQFLFCDLQCIDPAVDLASCLIVFGDLQSCFFPVMGAPQLQQPERMTEAQCRCLKLICAFDRSFLLFLYLSEHCIHKALVLFGAHLYSLVDDRIVRHFIQIQHLIYAHVQQHRRFRSDRLCKMLPLVFQPCIIPQRSVYDLRDQSHVLHGKIHLLSQQQICISVIHNNLFQHVQCILSWIHRLSPQSSTSGLTSIRRSLIRLPSGLPRNALTSRRISSRSCPFRSTRLRNRSLIFRSVSTPMVL